MTGIRRKGRDATRQRAGKELKEGEKEPEVKRWQSDSCSLSICSHPRGGLKEQDRNQYTERRGIDRKEINTQQQKQYRAMVRGDPLCPI